LPTVGHVRKVPWWGYLSSAAAPALLIGGWSVASDLQSRPFDAIAKSVSTLAADGATDRWVMTYALALVGVCDIVTALALRPAARPGRILLAVGGICGIVVAASPQPIIGGASVSHIGAATVGCLAMAIWPVAARRSRSPAFGLRPEVTVWVTAILLTVAAWFLVELLTTGAQIGLAERILLGAETIWPLIVVLTVGAVRRMSAGVPAREDVRIGRY